MNETSRLQLPGGQCLFLRLRSFGQLSALDLHDLLLLRQSILVVEQASAYPDLDGLDPQARHLTLHVSPDQPPIGAARLLPPGLAHPELDEELGGQPSVAFGRLVLNARWRGAGAGRLLVATALATLDRLWPGHDTVIGAQLYLERFYGGFGFARLGEVYDDGGIPHITMRRLVTSPVKLS